MEFVEKWNNGNMHERVKKIAVANFEHEHTPQLNLRTKIAFADMFNCVALLKLAVA